MKNSRSDANVVFWLLYATLAYLSSTTGITIIDVHVDHDVWVIWKCQVYSRTSKLLTVCGLLISFYRCVHRIVPRLHHLEEDISPFNIQDPRCHFVGSMSRVWQAVKLEWASIDVFSLKSCAIFTEYSHLFLLGCILSAVGLVLYDLNCVGLYLELENALHIHPLLNSSLLLFMPALTALVRPVVKNSKRQS